MSGTRAPGWDRQTRVLVKKELLKEMWPIRRQAQQAAVALVFGSGRNTEGGSLGCTRDRRQRLPTDFDGWQPPLVLSFFTIIFLSSADFRY